MSASTAPTPISGEALGELVAHAPASTGTAAARLLAVAAADAQKAPFVARALNALASLTEASSRRTLRSAVATSSDVGALLDALDQSGVLSEMGEADPLADARVRGARGRLWLLGAEGGTRSAADFGVLLGISRQAVDKRRRAGKLLGIGRGRRGYAYPVWQLSDGTVLPGLEATLATLDGVDPLTKAGFLLSPNTWLEDETPLAELRRGRLDAVLAAAAAFGDQVAA